MRELEWLTQYFQEREWQVEGRVGQLRKSTLRAIEGVRVGGSGAQTLQSNGHAGWEPGTKERAS